jgi:hypothetical protein
MVWYRSHNQVTIGGVNVTLPNLLNPTPKSAIVLFRQMIWGIPKSKGGIVIRKAFYFMVCSLFSVGILVSCAKSPQVPEVVATTTVVPQDTEVVATPTILPTEPKAFAMPTDVWHLLILSESSMWGLGEAYAAQIEKDVGVKVVVEDYAVGGLTVGEALNALRNEAPIRYDLSGLSAAISDADVIVMGHTGDPAVSLIPENKWDGDLCVYSIGNVSGNPPTHCNPAALEQYTTDLKWIWGEIFRLRNGQPTILRSLDVYNPWISIWNEKDIYLACTRCWENLSNAVHMAAEAYHIPFLSRYDAYNGVNHDEDPREKGYILSDGTHPTDLAQQVTAELLAKLGYDPVPPP